MAGLALLALVGYLFDFHALYRLAGYESIALHTAFTFLILSLGILAARPLLGGMQAITSNLPDGRVIRFLLPFTVILIILLGWLVEQGGRLRLFDTDNEAIVLVVVMVFIYSPLIYFFTDRIMQARDRVMHLNRLYATLSQINQTIVRVKDRDELYQSICKVAVQFGELSFAWIGIPDESGELRPVVVEGIDLKDWPLPAINYKQGPSHTGIAATAMQTSEVTISNNIQTDERTSYLFTSGAKYDFYSVAAIPFQLQGRTIGVLSLVSSEAEFFKDPDELRLLAEMSEDISFALDTMEAEHTRAYLASIVESSNDAIVTKDLNSIITSWNQGAESIFGYTAQEMIGQSILRLLPPDRIEEESEILDQIKRDQPIDHYETVRIGKDGALIDVSVTISPIKDAAGHVIGASKVARDITARKQAEQTNSANEAFVCHPQPGEPDDCARTAMKVNSTKPFVRCL